MARAHTRSLLLSLSVLSLSPVIGETPIIERRASYSTGNPVGDLAVGAGVSALACYIAYEITTKLGAQSKKQISPRSRMVVAFAIGFIGGACGGHNNSFYLNFGLSLRNGNAYAFMVPLCLALSASASLSMYWKNSPHIHNIAIGMGNAWQLGWQLGVLSANGYHKVQQPYS